MNTFVFASLLTLTNMYGSARVDTLGARVTSYVPAGGSEMLVMLKSGKGGIPVCWPWFKFNGPNGEAGIKHGFAKDSEFAVVSVTNGTARSEAVLRLVSDDATRRIFPHDFALTMRVTLDDRLHLELSEKNTGKDSFPVTKAFHPYLKRDVLPFLMDRGNCKYRTWDPDATSHLKTDGMEGDDWRKFVCVENGVFEKGDAYVLKPGERHQLKRALGFNPKSEKVIVRPTFVSCGIEFPAMPTDRVEVNWRADSANAKWQRLEVYPFVDTRTWRGSILNLSEDTAYEVRIAVGDLKPLTRKFRTWASDVPVARTVTIDSKSAVFPIVIDAKGTPEGWVRYTLPKGERLVNATTGETFRVENAAYVLLDDMTVSGGWRSSIDVRDSRYVRIRNCDLSGWGRTGPVAFDRKARHIDGDGHEINFDGAIDIGKGAFATVVERCFVHDPRGRANSWYYSHPAGPEAIMMDRPAGSTVIRYCDFVGSDVHRFNDAVEGNGNFKTDGGFNRDADVYGNYMTFANDDCIELDGGQRNVRCFGNRFENALCGVSIQGCMMSPVYVYDNLFSGMCDEFGSAGQTVKTGGGEHGKESKAFVFENILAGEGGGIPMRENLDCRLRDNRMDGFDLDGYFDHPRRPLAFTLSRGKFGTVTNDFAVEVTALESVAFTVRKPDAMDWFAVEPACGMFEKGGKSVMSVRLDREKMNDRRHYRGAFLVRTDDGMSRPVSFDVETSFVPPFKPVAVGDGTFYRQFKNEEPGVAQTVSFRVLRKGRYYFFMHAASAERRPNVKVGADGDKMQGFAQRFTPYPSWVMLSPGGKFGNTIRFYDFEPGEHKVTVSVPKSVACDAIALTDSPEAFEPR